MHRNLLMKVDHLPLDSFGQDVVVSSDPRSDAGVALDDTAPSGGIGSPHELTIGPASDKEQGQYPDSVNFDLQSPADIDVPCKVNMKPVVEKEQDLYSNLSPGRGGEPRKNNRREYTDSSSSAWELLISRPTIPGNNQCVQYDYDSLDESMVEQQDAQVFPEPPEADPLPIPDPIGYPGDMTDSIT